MADARERLHSRRQVLAAFEALTLTYLGASLPAKTAAGDGEGPLPSKMELDLAVEAFHSETGSFPVTSSDGTHLHCRRGGQGSASLLFVHGWSCNQDFFAHQILAAAEHFQVFALDLAGHGASSSRQQHSMERFADDVMAVAAESDGPLVLVAHSVGGRVACAVAKQLGSRLRGIIGLDCLQNLASPLPDPALIDDLADRYADGFEAEIANLVGLFFTGVNRPELQTWVTEQMSATRPVQAVAAFRAVSLFDAATAVQGLPIPVRVFNNDGVPTKVEAIRETLPDFAATILTGQSHFPHLVAPQTINELLIDTAARMLA